jgi:hypothetical protein
MGMDLVGANGRPWRFSAMQWGRVLDLAELYGWIPQGTAPPELPDGMRVLRDGEVWSGGYGSNDYQRVTADDARALAAALEQALDDLPGAEPVHKLRVLVLPNSRTIRCWDPDAPLPTAVEVFAGPDARRQLEGFIRFCRAGGFCIG